uniref:Reverse transcriptase domain-containing protein n=1 Tax=Tanacetum cinerariifolium TaxID=118510 RepID=A0A6L2KAU2_TANCI|nr:reverse transcriptase domain-containing protein [Tanacetum cinerariifolium]
METRPKPTRAATPPLRVASPRICRQKERTVGFEGAQSRGESGPAICSHIPSKNLLEYGGTVRKQLSTTSNKENAKTLEPSSPDIDDTLQILGLHEEQRISGFVHGLRTRSLVKHLSTDLPSTFKGQMEKTYTWVEAREVATNGASSNRRDSFEMSKKSSWDNNRGQKNKDKFFSYRGPNHGLLPSLSKSPKEILTTEKAARSFEPPSKMSERIKKERTKSFDTSRGESKKDKVTAPAEAPILMVRIVYMDSKSSCEIIYENCFEKLNPTIKATKGELKTPLVGFSRELSWSVGEVPLEIKIGDALLLRTETLNFVIVRFDSSHNMMLGRTAMQRMGIVVSTIHDAIKFYTKKGFGTVLSADETDEGTKRARKILATNEEGSSIASTLKKKLADGGWRMYVDFTDIDKASPKDFYPLPEIDWKIESLSGFRLKCFLDAYKGYHQIQMAEEYEDNTTFYVGEGAFCYKNMSFGRKNTRATYQRNEKETPVDFLVEIPFEDNEKKEKPKEVPDSNKQESRRAKQADINDLRTSHKGNASQSFDQKVNRGKRSFEGRYIHERKSWMDPTHEYLLSRLLPEDTKEARKIKI